MSLHVLKHLHTLLGVALSDLFESLELVPALLHVLGMEDVHVRLLRVVPGLGQVTLQGLDGLEGEGENGGEFQFSARKGLKDLIGTQGVKKDLTAPRKGLKGLTATQGDKIFNRATQGVKRSNCATQGVKIFN